MIKCNNIIELLKGIEVEWKNLDEVTNYEQPTKYLVTSTNYNDEYKTPVLTAGKTFILGYTNEIAGIYAGKNNPVIIFDDFTTANKWVNFDFKIKSSAMKIISSADEEKYNLKYIYYWMNTLPNEKIDNDHKRQWISNYANKKIPVPPFSIQTEIVRILDTFTALTAELTAELTTRKKQYNYYRDKLLSFKDDEVEWKALGEVGELIRGNGLQKKDFTETGIPAIHYGQIYTYYGTFATETKSFVSAELAKKLKKAQYGDILIAGTSENVKDVMTPLGWLGDDIVISGDMFAFRPSKIIDTKYLTYLLQTTYFQKFKEKYANGTKVIRIQTGKFLKFKIPIPPLKEQARIVEILDKFDTLTNSITEGLPREIELRQKQYEYYRNLLLDFPKD
jgi:type I restriction enzyme, S subunit